MEEQCSAHAPAACLAHEQGARTTTATAMVDATNSTLCAAEKARLMWRQPNANCSRCSMAMRAGWWFSG